MKRIEAIIRPHRQTEVLAALAKMQITGVTVLDTLGFGRQPGHSEVYEAVRPTDEVDPGLVPKRLLLMFVEDDHVQPVVDTILRVARTGQQGDGKIAVSSLEQLVRIRTNGEG